MILTPEGLHGTSQFPGEVMSGGGNPDFFQNIREEDIPQIQQILEQRVVFRGEVFHEEIAEIMLAVKNHVNNIGEIKYVICKNGDRVLGIVGMKKIGESDKMRNFSETTNPIEFVNLFVVKKPGAKGVGLGLIESLRTLAKSLGHSEMISNSGPRYERTWKLYDKFAGERVGELEDRYGAGNHASVWRKEF